MIEAYNIIKTQYQQIKIKYCTNYKLINELNPVLKDLPKDYSFYYLLEGYHQEGHLSY